MFDKESNYYDGKRSDFISMLPSQCKKILDIGCASGANWVGFTGEVYGVELNSDAATRAKKILKEVVSVDIESADLPFEKNAFDCLVLADVLEHLYDPWQALEKLKKHLKPKGFALVSIPNVRHYSVLKSLLFRGEFNYKESGILDVDHVRFFTKKSMLQMLKKADFECIEVRQKISATNEYKILNALFLGTTKDFLTEQYYILARLP
jgi:2-polyprenyl-3-methyl-5-hydroxy-6-metoxy-1,4-benzoquinol methylase